MPTDTLRLVAARQIQDLEEIRRHFGLRQLTLVAHSYGPLLAASYAIAHPDQVRKMVFSGPVPPRLGDFWTRYGTSLNQRLTTEERAAMRIASARRNDTTPTPADSRQACRDMWAIGLRPRVADPDRGIKLIKSDICASDLTGIRYGSGLATG